MDVVTLALAKQYTNSQRIAYTERGKRLWIDESIQLEKNPDFNDVPMFDSGIRQSLSGDDPEIVVDWNGNIYRCRVTAIDSVLFTAGNESLGGGSTDTGEPFLYFPDQ